MSRVGPAEPGAPARAGTARAADRTPPREAAAGDADRLARLLRRKEREEEAGEDDGEQQPPNPFGPSSPLGDAVLAGMGAASVEAAPGTGDAAQREALARLVDGVVDRVLVGGRTEAAPVLHASIRSEALGGAAEVEILRAADGLTVRIEAQGADGQGLLRDRGAELAATLSGRLGERVVVQVPAPSGGAGADDGDGRQRRSRGYEAMLSYAAG